MLCKIRFINPFTLRRPPVLLTVPKIYKCRFAQVNQLRETINDYNQEIQDYKAKEKKMLELQAKVEAYDKNIDETLNVKIK